MNSRPAVRLLIIPAQMARTTGISERLDSSSITELEVLHVCADFDDNASTFVTWGPDAKGRHGW